MGGARLPRTGAAPEAEKPPVSQLVHRAFKGCKLGPVKSPLSAAELCRTCEPESLPFQSTAELDPLEGPLGQERAMEATEFAVALARPGYNLFVLGQSGLGKHAFLTKVLEKAARQQPVPPDYCYVHDYEHPNVPKALALPAGRGKQLVSDAKKLILDLRAAIPAAFESEQYRARLQQIEDEFRARPETAFQSVEKEAKESGISMIRLPSGVGFAPMKDDEVLSPDEFEKLPKDKREELEKRVADLQQHLARELSELPRWGKQARDKVRALNREVTLAAVAQTIDDVVARYADLPDVAAWLGALRADVIDNADVFRHDDDKASPFAETLGKHFPSRYSVNLLVDNSTRDGAPVVYEDRPVVENLLGRVEHRAELGTLVSDFTLIKAGALHRANGGYLLTDLRQLLIAPHAWESLKRALFSREIRIESLGQLLGFSGSATLEPDPVPLDVKIVVIGDARVFNLLAEIDSDVGELFKVVADFDDRIDRTPKHDLAYARLIAQVVRRDELRHLRRDAVARVLEQRARATGDSRKLSTRMRDLVNLLEEADWHASERGGGEVEAEDVERAVESRIRRQDRLRERLYEQILRETILIDTSGEKVGQVNGLSVLEFGGFAFGMPTRITATARVGDGKVVDIEREVELGGALHSKGVLILSSYFAAHYTRHIPLSLSASLVFEQSYSGVEGDSASLAELCALISALAAVPVRQSIAMTGSVNQHGVAQAIGGVNEKVEAFFDICRARGLSGDQGVIIPESNVPHLMLRAEVVEACRLGMFSIYAVKSADEAVEVLTGVPAGEADEDGDFPDGTVNAQVLEQLVQFAVVAESFAKFVKAEVDDTPPSSVDPSETN
jgi:lon-related putative ATP-dependent protease